jgi:hypothetical protein
MSSSESTTDDAARMSPMAVCTLVVAAVCTTLLVVDAIASSAVGSAWPWLHEIGSLFRAGACVGWVVFGLAHVRDGLLPAMERAHSETRERVEKSHRETRETIAGVKSEVAVVCDQVGELRELFNALTVHVEAYGDGRETDGRIAAMRELTPTPLTPHEGMNGSGPRTLRATRPASN